MKKLFCLLLLICIVVVVTDDSSPPVEQKKSGDMMTQLFQPSQVVVVSIDYTAIETKQSNIRDRLMEVTSSNETNEQVRISSIQIPPQTKEGLNIKKDLSLVLFEALQVSEPKKPLPTLEGLEVQENFIITSNVIEDKIS